MGETVDLCREGNAMMPHEDLGAVLNWIDKQNWMMGKNRDVFIEIANFLLEQGLIRSDVITVLSRLQVASGSELATRVLAGIADGLPVE